MVWFYFVRFLVGWLFCLFWLVLASVLFGLVVGCFVCFVWWLFVFVGCLFVCLFRLFVCFVGVSCGGKPKTWEHMGWGAWGFIWQVQGHENVKNAT